MASTINPLMNGSSFDDEGPVGFPREMYTRPAGEALRLLEGSRNLFKPKKNPKKLIKEAEGTQNPPHSKKAKLKASKKPENLRVSGKKKKSGPFGESYTPVSAGKKGERVTESNRLRESVSADDLRGILSRALSAKFPRPQQDPYSPSIGGMSSYEMTPYVKDIFPDEHMVVFTMKQVLWAADYTLDKKEGAAKLTNIRRVETKYVDIGESEDEDDGEDMEESRRPAGRMDKLRARTEAA